MLWDRKHKLRSINAYCGTLLILTSDTKARVKTITKTETKEPSIKQWQIFRSLKFTTCTILRIDEKVETLNNPTSSRVCVTCRWPCSSTFLVLLTLAGQMFSFSSVVLNSEVATRGKLSYLMPLSSKKNSAPYFKQCFFRGVGGYYPPGWVKHHVSQSQDRNNIYFILYIEFCINNKI
jgi:hypothetical protein